MYTFMRTAEYISKLRTRPHEMSGLAPIYRQLEIFTELLFFPLNMDKTVYITKTRVYKYILRNWFLFFFYDIWKKKTKLILRQTPSVDDCSQIT